MATRRLRPLIALVFTGAVAMAVVAPVASASSIRAGASRQSPALLRSSRVILRLNASEVQVGQKVTVTAIALPRAVGRIVTLQRRGAKRWRNLASKVTTNAGKVVFHLSQHGPGLERLRATVLADTTFIEATSAPSTVDFIPIPPVYAGLNLAPGDRSAAVLALQNRLSELGYWLGTPDGYFGDATEQAVWAIQKAAGINRSGIVYPTTVAALASGVLPTPKSTTGYVIEINLKTDLVMFVTNGKIDHVINTSTGGGYDYVDTKVHYVADTPEGYFHIYSAVNKLVVDTLGKLWRPRFFDSGFAIHGDSYVPPEPVSHGCPRVSNEAIDWIWSDNLAPIGTPVWVYAGAK